MLYFVSLFFMKKLFFLISNNTLRVIKVKQYSDKNHILHIISVKITENSMVLGEKTHMYVLISGNELKMQS